MVLKDSNIIPLVLIFLSSLSMFSEKMIYSILFFFKKRQCYFSQWKNRRTRQLSKRGLLMIEEANIVVQQGISC
jgi:hypothetical protein